MSDYDLFFEAEAAYRPPSRPPFWARLLEMLMIASEIFLWICIRLIILLLALGIGVWLKDREPLLLVPYLILGASLCGGYLSVFGND